MSAGCRKSQTDSVNSPKLALFTEITERVEPGELAKPWPDGTFALPETSAGGVALFDYDGDGRLDILQVRHPPPGPLTAGASNRLLHQEPDGTFRDVTAKAGLDLAGNWQGVAQECAKAGRAWGILAPTADYARRMVERGCRFLALGSDIAVLHRGVTATKELFAEWIGEKAE